MKCPKLYVFSRTHDISLAIYTYNYVIVEYLLIAMYFAAPVCFNTTYCEGESVGDDLLSFDQCCFDLFGVSFASPGQCLLCPKTGN